MQRLLFGAGILIFVINCGILVYMIVEEPVKKRHKWVEEELAKIETMEVEFERPNYEFEQWHHDIVGKPKLWTYIVPPPPPPPKPPPKPPNIWDTLKDVQVTRQQIGDKVKIITPKDPRGSFYGVGETVMGLEIIEITRKDVTFALHWQGKELVGTKLRQ